MWKAKEAQVAGSLQQDLPGQLRQLEQQLAAREQEVVALREIAEAASELQSQDVQAQKVIELSKKNRALNLQLEKERHKVAKLQQSLSQQTATHTQQAAAPDPKAAAAIQEHVQEVAGLKERLQQMTNRMGQMEQKVFLLETENKKLARALVREVGEGMPLQKVLEEGSGSDWKGRREQIIRLQDTIKQLREAAGAEAPAASSASGILAKHEAAHRNSIAKANKSKDVELQRMAAELEAAKAVAEQLRLKFTGASSRRKVLEEEVAGLRDKLSLVLSKTQNDDKLIAALRAQLLAATPGRGRPADAAGAADGSFEVSQQRCSQLEEQVEQQQKVIRYLQAQLEGGKASHAPGPQQQQLQADNERLRQQLAVLQLGTAGASGLSALQQQVLLLQEENTQMREQLSILQPPSHGLHLTRSDIEVLEAAKEAAALAEAAAAGVVEGEGVEEATEQGREHGQEGEEEGEEEEEEESEGDGGGDS